MFVDGIAFGGNSIVSAKTGPRINKKGMPDASSYSWVEIKGQFRGIGRT
jgi:hypothetical protein